MRRLFHLMEPAETFPTAIPLCPTALLHLNNRAAISQALSRFVRAGELMQICQGICMRPIETCFGLRTPQIAKAIVAL